MNKIYKNLISFSLFVLLITFSACKQQHKTDLTKIKNSSKEKVTETVNHPDIPTPLGFHFINKTSKQDPEKNTTITTFNYKGSQNLQAVLEFYKQNLNQFGWETENLSTNDKILITCYKNKKSCVISAHKISGKYKTSLSIVLKTENPKEKGSNKPQQEEDLINSKKLNKNFISPSGYLC
ncbi:MAG: hypothetical protein UR14_C0003G0033 [candidate division TM6 bacterium GW2011_GWE2_31_21]|nr:MAG: hypothetical protein UR14_C0003G0033 [candidate division TM6 bacterium GW2011_GWE2_31_21]KKP54153.1 MAG: hypothetical protein UR43_C0001G0171 [candidate division TM6 bacterium GW2011_GWF2_33_332]